MRKRARKKVIFLTIHGKKWLLESVLYRVKSAFYISLKRRFSSFHIFFFGIDSLRSGEYVYVSGAADQGQSYDMPKIGPFEGLTLVLKINS